jgi:hypothetical protein
MMKTCQTIIIIKAPKKWGREMHKIEKPKSRQKEGTVKKGRS